MAFDGRQAIIEIDDSEKTVYFDTYRQKKISGTKLAPILGLSEFSTPFKVACELAGLYPGDKPNKYIDAGNILEPVIRNRVRNICQTVLPAALGLPEESKVAVEEPAEKELCGYDHFHNSKTFGGLVDGYVVVNGKRDSILEIKTSHEREKWKDADGELTNVPTEYILQASLYAELANLDRIVFAVGFLEDSDYDRPKLWCPTDDNAVIIIKDKPEMKGYMEQAEAWYAEYIKNGFTPEWTDRDADVLKYLRAFKGPGKKR
ncbi:MAG: YqaJ viral recombinase family protein [Candidatus Methanoplasma sp.]|jgi:hypothetical protein|nr:YqaJ viral recombinase family protein [Candidatus Methanoplasma sp.]